MTDNVPTDSAVFSMVRGHVESQARWLNIKGYMYHAGGASALAALAGMGVGLCCFGASTLERNSSAAEAIAASLTKAIAASPIQAKPVGSVTVAPGSKVELQDGASVTIAPNQTVALDPHSTVTVVSPPIDKNLTPTRDQLQADPSDNLARISTTYTIFHSQPYRDGWIDSVWDYTISDPNRPIAQSCSYRAARENRREYKVVIATDRTPTPSTASIPAFDHASALEKCVWSDSVS
jgi:hypothetical protein